MMPTVRQIPRASFHFRLPHRGENLRLRMPSSSCYRQVLLRVMKTTPPTASSGFRWPTFLVFGPHGQTNVPNEPYLTHSLDHANRRSVGAHSARLVGRTVRWLGRMLLREQTKVYRNDPKSGLRAKRLAVGANGPSMPPFSPSIAHRAEMKEDIAIDDV